MSKRRPPDPAPVQKSRSRPSHEAGRANGQEPRPGSREWMAKIRPPAPNKKHRLHARLEPEQVAARVAQLRAEHPHLQPRDEPLLRMLAVAYIKLEAAYSYQATTWYLSRSASGILNAQRFEAELRRTEERALSLAKELRLTPAARAGLEDPGGEDALAVIRRKVAVGGEDGHGDG